MASDVTRYIKPEVERELWARAAGRCQLNGCNRPLYKSPLTQESVNIAEKAHIWSFSKNGPRGWGPFVTNKKALNDIGNLMLLCQDCHKTVDKEKDGGRYTANLLTRWKDEHEKRIYVVTDVHPTKKSHVILYGANIGEATSKVQPEAAKDALFPDWYPAEERPLQISMSWEGRDTDRAYWVTEEKNLRDAYQRSVVPLLKDPTCTHLSVFAHAPMPLMTLLGALLTDQFPAQVYQLHREPHQTWQWLSGPADFQFRVNRPPDFRHPPVLIISLSAPIGHERITSAIGNDVSVWELTIDAPHNDFLKSKDQLSRFRTTVTPLVDEIAARHGHKVPLSIFPAMPVACAVELGRARMPKANIPWVMYDQNNTGGGFVYALTIQ